MVGRHRTRAGATRAVVAGVTLSFAAVCVAWMPALGQEGDGGPLFTFGLSTTISASDNTDLDPVSAGDTVLSETTLTFGFESITRIQSLRFFLSDTFRVGDGPGAPVTAGFRGTNAGLSYERLVANSRFDLSASLNTRDLDTDFTEDGLEDSDDLIVDSGTLTTTSLGFGLETGLEAPFGTELSLSQSRREYSGTTDPDLEDSRRRTGELALIFRPDLVTETRLAYTLTEFEQEDALGTERSTRSLVASVSRQFDPVTTITGSFGWAKITENWTAVPLTLPEDSGIIASLGFARDLSVGSFSAELSRDVTSAGGRTDLTVTRGFDLPVGTFEISLGATKPDGVSMQPTGRIAYSRVLPDQSFSVGISSDISVNSDSEVQRNTAADVSYSLDLNGRDSLGFGFDYAWTTDADSGAVTERTRASATASYQRELTRDWTLATGYTHRLNREGGAGTARSNTLFMTLQRDFAWRP